MKIHTAISDKLKESDFFLVRMKESALRIDELGYYFSAFVSAARSVTFVLQYVASDLEGFGDWYSGIQQEMRANPLSKFMLEARNEHQKRGFNPIGRGEVVVNPDGSQTTNHYFSYIGTVPPAEIPDADVLTACTTHMAATCSIVERFFDSFESQIHRPDEEFQRNLTWIEQTQGEGLTPEALSGYLSDPQVLAAIQVHSEIRPQDQISVLIQKYHALSNSLNS
ncbi:hypothetical protein [Pseudomonas sp. GM25]|uniref:hypothetical protein n=1 Tax=Pseudomonas sp. GM25 TaxID=1144327 RepID=UPI00027047F6|nr:hypothetical protein [Pseudomonas sp. GM25]EJM22570.1 hypothetical protein PMI24_05791 [Pseudomonas sp. GM25]